MPKFLTKTSVLFALVSLLTFTAPAVANGDPKEVVQAVIDQVLDILGNPAYAGPAMKQQRHQMARQIVDQHFDYREMTKRCLGPQWDRMSSAQKDDFVRLFSELLEASYADKIERYAKRLRIEYTGQSLEDGYAEVRTRVVLPNDRIPMVYRLLTESGNWMVYDVVIEGVSLVSNYRSQFARVIHQSSYNNLVQRLRNRLNELQAGG